MSSIPALPVSGRIRTTRPRAAGAGDSTSTFTALSRTVREAGLLRRARWFYALLGGGLLLALGGAIAGFVLLGESWFQLLIAAALGIIFTQAAFISHEASHRQVLASGPANDRLGRLVGVLGVGMSYQWWMTKHTRHHANPNQVGRDPDIEVDVVAFTPESAAEQRGLLASITRRQGWLFYPLLLLEGLNLHMHSVRSLLERRKVDGRWTELGLLALRFGVLYGAVFWLLPLGMAFAFVGVQLAVFGVYMGTSFAVNHTGMPIIGRDERLDFFAKQVRTSRNIGGGFWASALLGGLNYQVEHHLFPNMARPFLASARTLVREHSRVHDVPYTETSLVRAHIAVVRHMHTVGLAARDPFVCPVIAGYRRG
ncbi:acyl-CoA desaturase [Homoserinibacter sp. GY 40078]|uniref:fatty acid desaturase family protein n=1 Tax=Homoserinibacter sp. GY 40078 TaxID=2603275 RepID=UPI0011C8F0A6|nr:acyl-CoA desaturase [Homoserinibacter sp. GY 40078]TXK18636.1 acyl-CoA desaturase [Homoserinibacter sp. GY 40078]